MGKIPITMAHCEDHLSGFLKLLDREILQDTRKVTAELAKARALSEFEQYRVVQLDQSDFDKQLTALASPEQTATPRGNSDE